MMTVLYSLAMLALFGLGIFVLDIIRSIGNSGVSGLTEVLIKITPESKPNKKLEEDFDKFMKQKDTDDWN
jgi:hypothetical protein